MRDILLMYRLISVVLPHLNAISLRLLHDIIWHQMGG